MPSPNAISLCCFSNKQIYFTGNWINSFTFQFPYRILIHNSIVDFQFARKCHHASPEIIIGSTDPFPTVHPSHHDSPSVWKQCSFRCIEIYSIINLINRFSIKLPFIAVHLTGHKYTVVSVMPSRLKIFLHFLR